MGGIKLKWCQTQNKGADAGCKGCGRVKHGEGEYHKANGNVYQGQFKGGDIYHGKGTMVWANGGIYCGQWRDGKQHGTGKMTYPSGAVYDGRWRDNLKHGNATYLMANGYKYVGRFEAGKEHGFGCTLYPNTTAVQYEGQWKHGQKHQVEIGDNVVVVSPPDGKMHLMRGEGEVLKIVPDTTPVAPGERPKPPNFSVCFDGQGLTLAQRGEIHNVSARDVAPV